MFFSVQGSAATNAGGSAPKKGKVVFSMWLVMGSFYSYCPMTPFFLGHVLLFFFPSRAPTKKKGIIFMVLKVWSLGSVFSFQTPNT